MEKKTKIFISYSRKDREIVDIIDREFQKIGMTLIRDIRDLKIGDSIRTFMKRIRKSDFVLLIVSDSYLKSRYCMFEVLEVVKDDDYKGRILPIIIKNAKIYDPIDRATYIEYWQNQSKELESKLSKLEPQNLGNLSDELRTINNVCDTIGIFIDSIQDMFTVPFEELRINNYIDILEKIGFTDTYLLEELFKIRDISDLEEQELKLEEFIKRNPQYSHAYFLKAYIESKQKKYKKAIKYYGDVIELDIQSALAYKNRGDIYKDLKEYDKALKDYNNALNINPGLLEVYYNRGIIYGVKGNNHKAINDYTKIIAFDPNFLSTYFKRGNCYYAIKEYDKAINDYTKIITFDPNFFSAYYMRGNCYYAIKEYDKAIEEYTKSIELNPEFSNAYLNRKMVYDALKDNYKAREDYNKWRKLVQNTELKESNLNIIEVVSADLETDDIIKESLATVTFPGREDDQFG